jgi:hypothetical protein
MSANEDGRPSNVSAPPPPPVTEEETGGAIAQPGAGLGAFSMPDAQAGVQQDWYTYAASRALVYAQNGAMDTPGGHASNAAEPVTESTGAYAAPLAQQAPFLRTAAAEYEATEFPAGHAHGPAPAGDGLSGGPYALPGQGITDMDMPLSIGSHPYAARPGSMRRRRVGVFLQPDPCDTGRHASDGREPAASSTGSPDQDQWAPAWKEKETICAYCKTENWPRRTFCYQCRRDFASGWWHPDDCKCGDC